MRMRRKWISLGENGVSGLQKLTLGSQDGAKMAQDGAKMAQDGAKRNPRWSQDGPRKKEERRKKREERRRKKEEEKIYTQTPDQPLLAAPY